MSLPFFFCFFFFFPFSAYCLVYCSRLLMSVSCDNLTAAETDSVLHLKLLPRYYDLWRQLILKKLLTGH